MSQRLKILELLRAAPNKTVTCGTLSFFGCYHHGSQRIGELNTQGYRIDFKPGKTWDLSTYTLVSEPVNYKEEPNGQMIAFG